jgi:hypothetical protein
LLFPAQISSNQNVILHTKVVCYSFLVGSFVFIFGCVLTQAFATLHSRHWENLCNETYAECSKSFGLHKSAWERRSHSRPVLVPRRIPQKAWKGAGIKRMVPQSESCFRSLQMRYDIWRGCSHWSMSNGLDTSLSGILAFWYLDTGYLCKGENSNNQFALILFFAYRINSRYIWLLSCMVIDTLHLGDTSQRLRSLERFGFWFS